MRRRDGESEGQGEGEGEMGVRGGGGTDRIDDTSQFVGGFLKLAIAKVCAVVTWCAIRCTMFGRSSRQASRLADVQTQTKLLWSTSADIQYCKRRTYGQNGEWAQTLLVQDVANPTDKGMVGSKHRTRSGSRPYDEIKTHLSMFPEGVHVPHPASLRPLPVGCLQEK